MSTTENKIEKHEDKKEGDKSVAGKPITDKSDNAKSKVESDRLASKAMRFTTDEGNQFTILTDKGQVQDKRKMTSADVSTLGKSGEPHEHVDTKNPKDRSQLPTDGSDSKSKFPTDKHDTLNFHKNEDGTEYKTTTNKDGKATSVDYPKPPGGHTDVEYGPDGKVKSVHKQNPDGSETTYAKDEKGNWHKEEKNKFGIVTSDNVLPNADIKVQQEGDKNPGQVDVNWGFPIGGKAYHDGLLTNGKDVHQEMGPPKPFPDKLDVNFHKNADGTEYQTQTNPQGKIDRVDYPKPPGGNAEVQYGPDGKPKSLHIHGPNGTETDYEKDAKGQWHKQTKFAGQTISDEPLPPGTDVKVQQEGEKQPGRIDISWVSGGQQSGDKLHHDGYSTDGKSQHDEYTTRDAAKHPAETPVPAQERVLSSTTDSSASAIASEIQQKLNRWGGVEAEWTTGCHECGMLLNDLNNVDKHKLKDVVDQLRKDKNFVIEDGPPLKVKHHSAEGDVQIWPFDPTTQTHPTQLTATTDSPANVIASEIQQKLNRWGGVEAEWTTGCHECGMLLNDLNNVDKHKLKDVVDQLRKDKNFVIEDGPPLKVKHHSAEGDVQIWPFDPTRTAQERVLTATKDSPANSIASEIQQKLNRWGGTEAEWTTGCHECGMLLNQLDKGKLKEVAELLKKDKSFVIEDGPPLIIKHHSVTGDKQIYPFNP